MNVTEASIRSQFSDELALRKLIEKQVADKITFGTK